MNIIRKIRTGYRHTIYACYIGYITQAAVNSFAPLLFVIFQDSLGLSLRQITSLVTVNFCVQITVDLLAGKYADRIGYRKLAVAAHLFCVIGLTGFAWIPFALPSPFAGLLLCIVLNAIGGGIDEVLISPIVEACPDGKNKESAMGLLHSFYCWGVVGVVVITTLFLRVFGKENWRIICLLWGIVPLIDVFAFSLVPIESLTEDGESMRVRSLLGNSTFWLLMVLMIAVMIPLQLKFGAERARVILMMIYGGIAVLAFLVSKLMNGSQPPAFIREMDQASPVLVLGCIAIVVAVLAFLSYLWSIRIMEKKEF